MLRSSNAVIQPVSESNAGECTWCSNQNTQEAVLEGVAVPFCGKDSCKGFAVDAAFKKALGQREQQL